MKRISFIGAVSVFLVLIALASKTNAQTIYYYADVHYDSSSRSVDGFTYTSLDYYAGQYYDPAVLGELYRTDMNESPLDSGYNVGYADVFDAEVYLFSTNYVE